jgi:hypothetical protein
MRRSLLVVLAAGGEVATRKVDVALQVKQLGQRRVIARRPSQRQRLVQQADLGLQVLQHVQHAGQAQHGVQPLRRRRCQRQGTLEARLGRQASAQFRRSFGAQQRQHKASTVAYVIAPAVSANSSAAS